MIMVSILGFDKNSEVKCLETESKMKLNKKGETP